MLCKRRHADTPIRPYVSPSRPIFIATLWAGASWLFFRVARSTRMTQIWVLYRQSGSDRLEKQPTDLRQYACYFGDRTLGQHLEPEVAVRDMGIDRNGAPDNFVFARFQRRQRDHQ